MVIDLLYSQKCKTCPKSTSPQQFVHMPLWARSLGAAGTQPDRILFGIMMIMMMVTIIMIKMSIFGEISWWWEFPTALFYTFSKCRWNYIVTHRINKLIHLWLWHFDLHLPLDRVCLNTVNSTIGNGGLSRFRSRQCSTPGACCSKFPAWSLHTFAALAKKKKRQTHFCVGEHSTYPSQNAQIGWSAQRVVFFFQMKLGKHVTLMWS